MRGACNGSPEDAADRSSGDESVTERDETGTRREDCDPPSDRFDEFHSVVAHDLRNPLAVARGNLELARKTGDDEYLEKVAAAHDRMDALIDDLLALSRRDTVVGELEPVSLADCVEEAWETVATGGASLEIAVGATIEADRTRLQELFENLFSNAVDHGSTNPASNTPQGAGTHVVCSEPSVADAPDDAVEHTDGTLTVRVGPLEDGFVVADDGTGIPPDCRDRIFDADYSSRPDGTGFGLAIVETIADGHGWDVRAVDGDTGARFEITGVEIV